MNPPRILKHAVSLLFGLSLSVTSAEAATLSVSFVSDPFEFVGGGQTLNLFYNTAQGSTVVAGVQRNPGNGLYDRITLAGDRAVGGPSSSGMTLMFGTRMLGETISLGTYNDAERYSFESPGHAGLAIGFQSRAGNMVSGNFTITELEYNPATFIVQAFTATFTQRVEGSSRAMTGRVQYSLAGIPEPTSAALLAGACGLLHFRRRRNPAADSTV